MTRAPIPTTDLAARRHPSSATSSSGCDPTARASSPSCAPSGRSRSTRSRCRRPRCDFPQGPGFWALTRYADVMQVSPRSRHVPLRAEHRPSATCPPEIAEWLGSMINMDAPKHTKLRLIVNRGFTPRQVARDRGDRCASRRARSSTASRRSGECDFVSEIAAALPLQIICDMMGIPRERQQAHLRAARTSILGVGDPEYVQTMEELMGAGMELFQYGLALARGPARRTRATTSRRTLMHAEVEDENGRTGSRRASSARSSCCSSSPATRRRATRSATACCALTDHPDQRELWIDDFDARVPDRGRGDRALGDAGHPLPPHRDARHRASAARRSRPARRS